MCLGAQSQELEENVRCPSLSFSGLTPSMPGLPLFSACCFSAQLSAQQAPVILQFPPHPNIVLRLQVTARFLCGCWGSRVRSSGLCSKHYHSLRQSTSSLLPVLCQGKAIWRMYLAPQHRNNLDIGIQRLYICLQCHILRLPIHTAL